jgi:ABC-type nitrate/sulfonate/bicarbonate transport system substrate-binding protein
MKRVAAALGLALLFLVACTRGAPKLEPIEGVLKLAYMVLPQGGIIQVALEKGLFAAEGLKIEARPFEFGKLALASVIKGESDLSISAETPVVFAVLAGENLGIATVIGTWDKNTVIVANKASGVHKPSDLAGKAIGVTMGTTGEYFLETFLLARGIAVDSVRIIDMQPDGMLEALLSNQIAAAVTWTPIYLDIGTRLAEQAIVFFGDDFYTEHIVISGSLAYMKKNPQAMKAFMRAIIKAEKSMETDTDETVAIISRYSNVSGSNVRTVLDLFSGKVSMDQSLLLQLEDETRWALRLPAYAGRSMPNWLEYLYTDALDGVDPDRVRVIR